MHKPFLPPPGARLIHGSVALATLALSLAPVARGQTAPDPLHPADEPQLLSPFQVNAQADTGYEASSTLLGTRLRTDLKDVPASISVVTKDFMRDIGANNLEALLTYTTGTEVNGLGGNFSNAPQQGDFIDFDNGYMRSPSSAPRLRGLSTADQTRDYFLTSLPMDGYNTERVEISRGPNAMLFGLGSPSGIINSALVKAGLSRSATTVEVKLDNWGTHRESLDTNQVLIPNKLAIRVAGLFQEQYFQQKPAYVRDRRIFATVTYRPWEGATLRANTESARQNSNKPQNRPPYDSFTWWWKVGKPVYDPTTGTTTLLGTPVNADVSALNPNGTGNFNIIGTMPRSPSLVMQNPNVASFGISGLPSGVQAIEMFNASVHANSTGTALVNDGMRRLQYSKNFNQRLYNSTHPEWFSYWRDSQLTDPSVFNFFDNMIEGPNKNEWAFWNTYNVTFEQRLGRHAGVELVWDRQNLDNGYVNDYNWRDYDIQIDINTKLPNGQTNPNFGRPFISNNGWEDSASTDRDAYRATAYYELDAREYLKGWLAKALGRHVVTGSYTGQRIFNEEFGGRPYLLGLDYYDAETANGRTLTKELINGADDRFLNRVTYLGPSVTTNAGPAGAGLQRIMASDRIDGLSSVNTLYYQSPSATATTPSNFVQQAFSLVQSDRYDKSRTANYTAYRAKSNFQSGVVVLNSYWLDSNLVSTLGWRRDAYKTYSANAPSDPNSGLRVTDPSQFYPALNLDSAEDSFNWGMVGHLPASWRRAAPLLSDVSVSYNKADNFQPTAQRFGIYKQPLGPQTGKTKEYGLHLGFLADKFEVRVVHYETSLTNSNADGLLETKNSLARFPRDMFNWIADPGTYNPTGSLNAAIAAWNNWATTSPEAATLFKTFDYTFATNAAGYRTATSGSQLGTVVAVQDLVSRGYEFEGVYNPLPNWRLAFNGTREQVVQTNIAPDFQAFLAKLVPELTTGPLATLPQGPNSGTTLGDFINTLKASFDKQTLLDGAINPEVRRWRFNALTNYTLTTGVLKGIGIGGAVRWQDKIALGYPVTVLSSGNSQYDVHHPYYGPTETNFDAWVSYSHRLTARINWMIQLNVRNLGVHDKLIPVAAQPDGSIAAWRIAEPMTWTLTNTLRF